MKTSISFNSYIEQSVIKNWNSDALTDYKGITLQYHDVARKIEKIHIMFENCGVTQGDKVAICGRNSAMWAAAFLATITYGAVAVPILHEFNSEQIHNIVNHSEAKLLFVGDVVAKQIDADQMPNLEGIFYLPNLSLLVSRSEKLTYAREHLNMLFGSKFPNSFTAKHVHYHHDAPDELALINYTSGTTGFSKGVMLPYRSLTGNLEYILKNLGRNVPVQSNMLSILPMAHMYGMAVEFLFAFGHGCHLYFLSRLPSPAVIAQAFADIKPSLIVSVPLIIEKIIRKKVFPLIQTNRMKLLLNMPIISKKVKQHICEQVKQAFGGNFYEIIVGGAPLNQEIEKFLRDIEFPITIGYGTTECAPLISFIDHHDFVSGCCGRPVDGMEVKILSPNPREIAGEIVTRGRNLMLGYYKNDDATMECIDEDGWYHTGDLATIDNSGRIFIRGRIKNMLLGSNGQNVYPEEIEDKLNSMTMVNECIVVQRGQKIVALVHPDFEEAKNMGFSDDDIKNIMEQNRIELNALLPAYSKVSTIEIHEEEFEKTPKKSIKRYLYRTA